MRAKVDDACEIDAGDLAEALELAYPGESVGLTQEAVDGLPVGQREVLTKLYLVPDVLRVDAATVAASLGVTERNVRLREDESFSQLGVCVRPGPLPPGGARYVDAAEVAAAILRRYPRATGTDGLTQEALNRRLPMAREALRLRFSSGAFTSSKDVSVALNITGESAQDLIDGALHKLGVLRDVGPDPGPPLDATEVRLAIRRRWPTAQGLDGVTHDAVMNLSPYSIEIVRMRFIGQMSAMDACVAIGLWHPDAVYRRESRALDQLGVRRYDVAMPVRRHVVPRMAHHKSQRSQPWT